MPTTTHDALTAIAELLAPGEPDIAARTTHAHTDPASYLHTHADQLDERGIDEPIPNLAWIALIDALTDHGYLAEIDWKEAPEEITGQLRALRTNTTHPDTWTHLDTTLHTYDFLQHTGHHLTTTGTALAVLDLESDCYPLVLLPADRATELVHLATTAGFTAAILTTDQD